LTHLKRKPEFESELQK